MANDLKQSTAVDIAIGPFVDATDGVTPETGLTIAQADVRLKKNNGAWAQKNDNTSAVHEENGWYECELDATDTNTLGILVLSIQEAGALPVWERFNVISANDYDNKYGTTTPQVRLAATGLDLVIPRTGFTAKQVLGYIVDAVCGVLSGAATTNVIIKSIADGTTTTIDATVDANGNRSAVTLS